MLYVKPHFYDEFCCIADRCPETCCAGWQIMIDEESLEKYRCISGGIGNRLLNSIDWEEGAFLQYHDRCSWLNEKNLCDLYEELGEAALCQTCRMYPRHVEEFEGVRELSLSLSCPEAARMILECEKPVVLLSEETEEEEPEPYEDFDFLLYSGLNDIRERLFQIVQNREESTEDRMKRLVMAGHFCQREYDSGYFFDLEDRLEQLQKSPHLETCLGFEEKKAFFHVLFEMESLHKHWGEVLQNTYDSIYRVGENRYHEMEKNVLIDCWEQYAEQLLMFFLYTYFCGAVYDERIASKVYLAVYSTIAIHDFCMSECLRKGKPLEKEEVWKFAWQYAREIEHSDVNLEILETYFESLCCIRG